MLCKKCNQEISSESKFCKHCGARIFSKRSKIVLALSLAIFLFTVVGIFSTRYVKSKIQEQAGLAVQTQEAKNKQAEADKNNQQISLGAITPSIVNIVCPLAGEPFSFDSDRYSGSGTIWTPEGMILTNAHVIPHTNKTLNINKQGCFVILPDSKTGEPKEIYLARPDVKYMNDKYDLAFLFIYGVFTDSKGSSYGEYPNKFPSFNDTKCQPKDPTLGESVRVLGYPKMSNGYNLIITEGVISGFQDGYILTSAKLDSGNSGGLAVDERGCPIGIPSAVYEGNYSNLGVITSTATISDYIDKLMN